ncbi:hypothetical protein DUI87_03699 [Hirundo rustica rustica]|uniref:Uncharacterized protein n=1 Tax=Hirundo rustica rustica TaxID=333673 RepID=A0A3M0L116_HIRRU|nr:hypothetical protein DUI87_03699 [Hirundo rustica rustica]
MLCLMHPRKKLSLLAARALLAHVQLARTPRCLSMALLSSISFSSLSIHPGLPHPRSRIQHFPLLKFIWSVIAQTPDLSRSLLQGLPPLEGVNISQFCIICKPAQYPIQSCVQVIYEDVEEQRAEDGALKNPSSDRFPVGFTPFSVTLCS